MDDGKTTSFHLYQYLCKFFGSPEVVNLRRAMYTAAEAFGETTVLQWIPSGSRSEGLEMEGSDFDIVILDKSLTVHETLIDGLCKKDTVSVIMDDRGTKPGFTRLLLPNMYYISDNAHHNYHRLIKHCFKFGSENYISSMLVRDIIHVDGFTTHGPCQIFSKLGNTEQEILFCYRCPKWISLASSWIRRIRRSWPSQQLIDDIIQYGVLFVPVGSKTSKYERIEWRISFSIAEKKLIHSFSHVQLLCYALLKVVVSDIIKKQHGELLCSYFVKTIMFWLSEELETNFWSLKNIDHCLTTCIKRLIYCVQNRYCRHYFIPEINFFEERFNETDHKALLSSLYQLNNTGWKALLYTNTFLGFRSLTLRHPDYSSSVLLPLLYTSSIIFSDRSFDLLLEKIICFSNLASKSTERVMLYVIAFYFNLNSTKQIGFSLGNKQQYKQYKRLLPYLILSTRSDCVSGCCHIASLFYKLKLYRKCNYIVHYCLTKCTQDNIGMIFSTHIILPDYIQNIICKSRWFPAVLHHCFIGGVLYRSQSLLPGELVFLLDTKSPVWIPIVVFIYFLKFVCAHNLQQKREKTIAFRELQRTVRNEVFIFSDDHLLTAWQIVEVAERFMHET